VLRRIPGRRGSIVHAVCLVLAVSALALLALGCTAPPGRRPGATGDGGLAGQPAEAAPGGWAGSADPSPAQVEARLRALSLRDKVGQLFMTYVFGSTVDDHAPGMVDANRHAYGVDDPAGFVRRFRPGGVIYFPWAGNLHDPAQIARLSAGLQRAALRQPAKVPLLIATDQEQGLVSRIGPPATQFPGAMALGATRDAGLARAAATSAGAELRAMGIVQDLAPVADVNVNPRNPVIGVRSFGADPAQVSRLTAAQVDGYQAVGVAATAKHFPGHGDTAVDSHAGLPVIGHSRRELRRTDLAPFRAAIAGGVGAIMSAHIVVPALDPSRRPATLSKPILDGLLRHQLGYDGVVITDSLEMAAVRQRVGDERVPVEAILAGADMLLMPPRGEFARQFGAVLGAVRSGRISQARLDQSVRRILLLKLRLGLFDGKLPDAGEAGREAGASEHRATAARVASSSITLLRNQGRVLPLRRGDRVLVTGSGDDATALLARRLAGRGADARALPTGSEPGAPSIAGAVAAARSSDAVVVLTRNAWTGSGAGQRRLVAELAATGRPLVAVVVRDPYDAAYLGGAGACLVTYGDRPASLEALARVLDGEIAPAGRLPVAIPAAGPGTTAFPIGAGLAGL
jgi:beta-N-acetylhexosaminidase